MNSAEEIMHRANLVKDVMDVLTEASTPSGLIPNSWVDENGVRHATIWNETIDQNMRIVKSGSDWVVIDLAVF